MSVNLYKVQKIPKKNTMEYLRLKEMLLREKGRIHEMFYHPFKIQNNNKNLRVKYTNVFDKFKDTILISFIIPVYNCAPYIARCLDSILNQTIKNIEIIVINDGSTDGIESILYNYQKKYKNITVIHQKNKGVSAARNAGIRKSKGMYLSFIDGDDYITKDMSEYLLKRCLENDLDACFFDFQLIDIENKREINASYYFRHFLDKYTFEKVITPYDIELCILNNSMGTGIYKRKIFVDNNILYKENIINGEDCLVKFDNFYLFKKIMFVNKTFYMYCRNRKDSATTTINNHVDRILAFLDELLNRYFKHLSEGDERINVQFLNLALREITYYCRIYRCPEIDKWCKEKLQLIDPDLLDNPEIKPLYLNRLKNIIDVKKFKTIFQKRYLKK